MKQIKNSLIAFVGVLALVGLVTFLAPSLSQGQGPPSPLPPPLNVKVVNTESEPVPVTGTINVGNIVQTQTALPSDAFSVVATPSRLILGPDPEGTKYAITSLTVANSGDTLSGVRLSASSDGPGGPENTGPAVVVPAGQSVHLSFPQPFVLSAPPGGDSFLLRTESVLGPSLNVTVVGYRF